MFALFSERQYIEAVVPQKLLYWPIMQNTSCEAEKQNIWQADSSLKGVEVPGEAWGNDSKCEIYH